MFLIKLPQTQEERIDNFYLFEHIDNTLLHTQQVMSLLYPCLTRTAAGRETFLAASSGCNFAPACYIIESHQTS